MDHPAPVSAGYPWRRAALVASALATVELVLLLLVVLLFVAGPFARDDGAGSGASTRSSGSREGTSGAASTLPRGRTWVIVLNGNGVPGAAGRAAATIRSLRYRVRGSANAPRSDFARSLIMFRRGYRSEAIRLAQDLRLGRVAPLDGLRAPDLQGAHLALIVGKS